MGIWQRLQQGAFTSLPRVVILVMFIGVPMFVWWTASPLIATLPMGPEVQFLLGTAVTATLAVGAVTGFLVWRDLDEEP